MICPSCGAAIPANAPAAGLCPACLLDNVIQDDRSAPESIETALLNAGSNVGRFQIVRLLGSGGMAAVYEAYEAQLDRRVALKVLPSAMLHDHTFAHRFEQEARLVATLEHPHIVPIYASGIDEGMPWLSMRLLPGGTLSGMLTAGALSPDRTVLILRGVAEAIDYAHGRGVMHRDIKPSNIVLDERGVGCLVDFGVARLLERDSGMTYPGTVIGTPLYMSPEQAAGHDVDHRADLYSLGIVAYEMLTGAPPFTDASPMAILVKQIQSPPPRPPRDVVSRPVARVLLRALSKAPSARWPTALTFVDSLEVAIASQRPPWLRWIAVAGLTSTAAAVALLTVGPFFTRSDPPSGVAGVVPSRPLLMFVDLKPPAPAGFVSSTELTQQRLTTSVSTELSRMRSSGGKEGIAVSTSSPERPADAAAPATPTALSTPQEVSEIISPTPDDRVDPPATSGNVDVPPLDATTDATVRHSNAPVYPAAAKAAGIEGQVVVDAQCEIDGRLTSAAVVRSSHQAFEDAALKAVLSSTCQPKMRNGTPEASSLRIPVEFRLK